MDAILHRRDPTAWERLFNSPSLLLAQKAHAFIQRRSHPKITYASDRNSELVRVVCISDTHNQHEATTPLPDGDVLIHAGDLTQSGTTEELERALEWLNTQPHLHRLFIAGNHDAELADPAVVAHVRATYPSLVYLQESRTTVTVRGRTLHVFGTPNTPRHGSWPFQYPRVHPSQAETSTQWSSIPLHTNILITHGPPAYHLDNGGGGCVALLHTLWRVRPVLHVFGHIHAAHGIERVSWTPAQRAFERICESRGGWWNLLVMLAGMVWLRISGGRVEGTDTMLVNASVVGGYRDEFRRPAIVVDI